MNAKLKKVLFFGFLFVMAASGAWLYQQRAFSNHRLNPEAFKAFTVLPTPRVLGELSLTTLKPDGQHWQLLFFGFTHCPDVCPNTLALFKQAYVKIGAPEKLKITLVSVDPARDSLEQVNEYARYFHKSFVGTTGTSAQLEVLGKKLGAVWQKVPVKGAGGYTMDHSATLFLLNPEGNLAAIATPPLNVADLAADFEKL